MILIKVIYLFGVSRAIKNFAAEFRNLALIEI